MIDAKTGSGDRLQSGPDEEALIKFEEWGAKPLAWWRAHLRASLARMLAKSWPWWFAGALLRVPAEFVAGQIFDLKNDHRQALTNLNLMLSYPMLVLFALSLIAAFAYETQRQVKPNLEFSYYGSRRVTRELHERGWRVNRKKVQRLMREDNLLCLRKRRFTVITDSNHATACLAVTTITQCYAEAHEELTSSRKERKEA